MPMIIDVPRGWRTPLQRARDPGLLALVGAGLLLCAPVLPGISRLVVLPALLLAPGYALLRLLGQATGVRSISVVVPVSIVLVVCASLVLDGIGIRLGPVPLGLLLGAVTVLFLAGSYVRQPAADAPGQHRRIPRHRDLAPETVSSNGGDGRPVIGYLAGSGHDEADPVTEEMDRITDEGAATPEHTAAGDVRFYHLREVRDVLAYLRLIANPEDEKSLRRVLNVPKRGIGDQTEKSVAALAEWDHTSFPDALTRPDDVPGLSPRSVRAIEAFNELLAGLRADADAGAGVADLAEAVLERSGYVAELGVSRDPQDAIRIENLKELVAVAREFDARHGRAGPRDPDLAGSAPGSLADFLEQVSLVADTDRIPAGEDPVAR